MRWILAAAHLLSLGIGLGAIWVRARVLRGSLDPSAISIVLSAHRWWGLAGHLWIATGVLRLLSGSEKGIGFYFQNYLFLVKMGLLVLMIVLEAGPLVTLRGWRRQLASGDRPDTSKAKRLATVSMAQVVIVILMVIVATGMARGYGIR